MQQSSLFLCIATILCMWSKVYIYIHVCHSASVRLSRSSQFFSVLQLSTIINVISVGFYIKQSLSTSWEKMYSFVGFSVNIIKMCFTGSVPDSECYIRLIHSPHLSQGRGCRQPEQQYSLCCSNYLSVRTIAYHKIQSGKDMHPLARLLEVDKLWWVADSAVWTTDSHDWALWSSFLYMQGSVLHLEIQSSLSPGVQ